MLIEQQIAERQARAKKAVASILKRPAQGIYGDYQVKSASKKVYRVALRGAGLFENYCSCPDFAINTLGTCKHIEAVLQRLRHRHGRALEREQFVRARASISLHYGEEVGIRLRLPGSPSAALKSLAERYFDARGLLRSEDFRQFGTVLEEFRKADDQAVIYSDVLDYIERQNEAVRGLELEGKLLAKIRRGQDPLAGILKTKLLPYQIRGALFAACRGRVILADDMGLGKTVQALAAAELLRRQNGIQRVLVIAPASVKYQWKTEIEKFTGLSAQVIDGSYVHRRQLYKAPAFFNLASYELVRKDLEPLQAMGADLIILDEAQRIRNWATATAKTVKQLKSRYAFVLTGTPLENKLEELFSVVEFIDGRRLGPAFRFLQEHRVEDDHKRITGYRGLDRIHHQLQPILLRRTRQEVLKELPERTDQIFKVPLTKEQAGPYEEQYEIVARIVHKWTRQRWLSEIDLRRMTCALQNMRMICNSTFLYDKETHHSPKLEEFREIIRELAIEEGRKVVVFSEYERMTYLAGEELRKLGIGFVSLHGGVPAPKRGGLMEKFKSDAKCKVFLSTDAGGVGLNLQSASAVINFEPPWNPARLEQRIGRVHRLGQLRPVQVVHLLTTGSIEERIWEIMRFKKAVFAGIFDSPTDEVSFAALGKKSVLQAVKEIVMEQPEPKPAGLPVSPAAAAALPAKPTNGHAQPDGLEKAAAGLIEAGLSFIEALAAKAPRERAEAPAVPPMQPGASHRISQALSALVSRDARTNQPVLSIPLPESVTGERLTRAIGGLLGMLQG
ncbi:MAG TPA: DEAD/DEAH box helicase [Candidatus Saccharimonadales bacterium]|nr:DEAD/DEAH box helicase [Candidatus Saccharimonadales bacterium]